MYKFSLLLIGVLAASLALAQGPASFQRNEFKFSPLKLVDPMSGIEFSYERIHGRRQAGLPIFATQVSVARLGRIFYDDGDRTMNGYRYSIEEKRFFRERSRKKEYLSLEFIYLNVKYIDHLFRDDTTNRKVIDDPITVRRQTASINFKYGYEIYLRPLVIDLAAGLGLKYRVVKYYDIDPSSLPFAFTKRKEFTFDYPSRREGKSLALNLPVIVKVGITF